MQKFEIVDLELDMATLGYWSEGVTGIPTLRLTDAVRVFQKANGLVADGIAGPKTRGKLTELVKNRLQLLVLHCSATRQGLAVTAKQIAHYHTSKEGRGWSRPGYADIIELDGKLVNVWKQDDDDFVSSWETTNGMLGAFNKNARHICYVGGCDLQGNTKDTRNAAQLETMKNYILEVVKRYPNIVIIGHHAIQNKGCPSFNVPKYLESIGVGRKNMGNFRLY
jgi:septum formation topological specificity factor MinE